MCVWWSMASRDPTISSTAGRRTMMFVNASINTKYSIAADTARSWLQSGFMHCGLEQMNTVEFIKERARVAGSTSKAGRRKSKISSPAIQADV